MIRRLPRIGFRRYISIRSDTYDNVNFDSKASGYADAFSPFRNSDGSWIKGSNAKEARLHDFTLQGQKSKRISKLPPLIARTINDEILSKNVPERLRSKAALLFQSISKDQIQRAPENALDCDAYIASLFLQDYANVETVLKELQKRLEGEGKTLQPERVLDIGYGPSTGMLALNEIMGDDFAPRVKDSYIIGRNQGTMRRRAKVLLSRQLNEYNKWRVEEGITETGTDTEENAQLREEEVDDSEETVEGDAENTSDLKDIDFSKIDIHTKLRTTLPSNKLYDLIIVNQCLLTREYNFPKDVDFNLHPILRLLSPGGHIVLVERGNALGFETIARARQVMIRPEAYEREHGKIPRPYVKGSNTKPQKLKGMDSIITEEDVEFEKNLLAKYGEADEEDLKFEFEESDDFEVVEVDSEPVKAGDDVNGPIDYHLKIIAPCSHHAKCPLQLGNPTFYKIPKYKNKLQFCSYHQTVQRPKFTLELKKGKKLATTWDKSSQDGFGFDRMNKKTVQKLEGSGRPGGNDYESGSYSYLIVERSHNDTKTLAAIDEQRKFQNEQLNAADANNWARIIKQPTKQKQNVKLDVCAPSGRIEIWDVPKSVGIQEYHDARKVERGDLWALGKKTVTVRNIMSDEKVERMKIESKMSKKKFLKDERRKKWKKIVSSTEGAFDSENFMTVADELATELESSKKYKTEGKRAGFRGDPRDYDGL